MNDLMASIEQLKKSEIKKTVESRIKEFSEIKQKSADEIFKELCFCILTANFNAEKCIKIQNEISECFLNNAEDQISIKLKEYGHRYPNTRAKYINDSKKCKDLLFRAVKNSRGEELRELLVKNIKSYLKI